MSDYRLDRLNTREFEHLTQSLCKEFIAVGTTPFGDGPDGGREATFEGLTKYPSVEEAWKGYTSVQCKFRQRSTGNSDSDAEWVLKELKKELSKFHELELADGDITEKRRLKSPNNYLFVTNAVLTPVSESGGRDKCEALMMAESEKIGIEKFDIWGYDDICRYLDLSFEIRRAYCGFILPDDLLHEAITLLKIDEPNFQVTLSKFLQKELKSDAAAKLQSAGQYDEKHEILLSHVFLDVPFNVEKKRAQNASDEHNGLVEFLLSEGDQILTLDAVESAIGERASYTNNFGRFAVVGGPGQGKSTMGQYLCQLYRAAIIGSFPPGTIDPSIRSILASLAFKADGAVQRMPQCRRFPFRIVLNSFATDLANDKTLSVIEYVRRRLVKLGSISDISLNQLQKWVSGYPWLFVLDGLDEVPAGSNRIEVLEAVENFLIDIAVNEADVLIIATTRPQGYADDLAKALFQHLYLAPLAASQALTYGTALLKCRAVDDEDRFDLARRRLEMAAQNTSALKLMSSPLQVTIMATLVERLGEPPKQRYRLFAEYYRTIYDREVSREGSLSRMLSERKTDIDIIHHRTGFLLQAASENAGDTDACFTIENFIDLVHHRLINELGVPTDDAISLIEKFRQSALHRLVFLVSPQNDQIGFEIRSLQEFMAAEALCKADKPELIVKRINEIAPIDHWRNVLLFVIGKFFVEDNNSMLDRILLLCEELNDDSDARRVVKWGSRIALETLVEGVARNHPKRERQLCKTALQLLDSQSDEYSDDLFDVYHRNLDDLYSRKLSSLMANNRSQFTLMAWKLLQNLAVANVEWAKDLFNENWLKISPRCRAEVINANLLGKSGWLLEKIILELPSLSPLQVADIFEEASITRDLVDQGAINSPKFGWVEEIIFEGSNILEFNDTPVVRLQIQSENLSAKPIRVIFNSVVFDQSKPSLRIKDIPFLNVAWLPNVAVAKFLALPGKKSLAESLRLLASFGYNREVDLAKFFWGTPWPFLVFTLLSNDADELRKFAVRIDSGEFGDIDDWENSEKNTLSGSVHLSDVAEVEDSRDAIALSILSKVPIIAMRFSSDIDSAVLLELVKSWRASSASYTRSWIARQIVAALTFRSTMRPNQDLLHVDLSVSEAFDILQNSKIFLRNFDIRLFDRINFNIPDDLSSNQLMEVLATSDLHFSLGRTHLEGTWLSKQLIINFSEKALNAQMIYGAKWYAQMGGLPSISETRAREAVSSGYTTDNERFYLKFGSGDFSVSDALEALSYSKINWNDGAVGSVLILAQIRSSVERLNPDKQLAVSLAVLKFLKENLRYEDGGGPLVRRFVKIVERSLIRDKTCFSLDAEVFREFEFPVIGER